MGAIALSYPPHPIVLWYDNHAAHDNVMYELNGWKLMNLLIRLGIGT